MEVPIPNFYFMGIQFVHLFALAVWVGGIVILGAIVAPTIFLTVKPRHLAGELMGRILLKFDKVALFCSASLISTGVVKFLTWENLTPWNATRYLAISLMTVACIYSAFVISPRLRARRPNGLPDEQDLEETRSQDFGRLHLLSVRLMMGSLICGTVALLLA